MAAKVPWPWRNNTRWAFYFCTEIQRFKHVSSHPLPNLEGRRVVLASQSPRRRELDDHDGVERGVHGPRLGRIWPAELKGRVAEFVARKKRTATRRPSTRRRLITGDTVVVLHGKVLEKPVDEAHAKDMLSTQRPNPHRGLRRGRDDVGARDPKRAGHVRCLVQRVVARIHRLCTSEVAHAWTRPGPTASKIWRGSWGPLSGRSTP